MFFVFGINNSFKELNFSQNIFCKICGNSGKYTCFATYMAFSFFFIPIFNWNKKYFIRSSCCDTIYEIDKQAGKKIEAGEDIVINDEDIITVSHFGDSLKKQCPICHTYIDSEFSYCPKCGNRL